MQNIALGSVQFGMPYGIANKEGQVSINEIEKILDFAKEAGINTLDTAINYGKSESILGQIGISNWNVITKLPELPVDCKDVTEWVNNSVFASLERLNINNLNGLLLHYPQQLLCPVGDELYDALKKLKDNGYVKKIGISIYEPKELDVLLSRYLLDIVQAPFNIIDQRLSVSGWLSRLSKKGVEVHVRSVFLQGLLLMSSSERPSMFNRWESLWSDWDQWLCDTNLNALQACLRYTLSKNEINRVIVGVDNLKHLREVLSAAEGEVPGVPPELICDDLDLINPSKWNIN